MTSRCPLEMCCGRSTQDTLTTRMENIHDAKRNVPDAGVALRLVDKRLRREQCQRLLKCGC